MKERINISKADISLKEFVNSDWIYESSGSLLHLAAESNNLNLVKEVINYGAELNKLDDEGRTALFLHGELSITKELIKAGINPDIIDLRHRTALTTFYLRNPEAFRDIIEYLIKVTNLDLPKESGRTLLFTMIDKEEDDYNLFKIVIDNTKNLNRLIRGETFLFRAARHIKNEKIFLLLVKSGVNLNHKNKKGMDFYDYCSENIQNSIKKHLPEFIQRR